MLHPVIVTAPTDSEILGLLSRTEMKAHVKVSYSQEDTLIDACITDAYRYLEFWLNRAVLTQTQKVYLPAFANIELPNPPLQAITKVRYRDADNVWQTMHDQTISTPVTSTVFNEVVNAFVGRMELAKGQRWPDTYEHPEAVEVTYNCGFGDADAVKLKAAGIIRGMRLLAGHFFLNREETYAEPRLVQVNRRISFGLETVAGMHRIAKKHA